MGYAFLGGIIIILAVSLYLLYRYHLKTLDSIDKMLDCAKCGTFQERDFSEEKLSKIEAKMYQYLSAGNTSLKQIAAEKNAIKTLISDISHQSKTPLANIMLYSELLKEKEGLDETTKELISQITKQAEKLSFLIAALVKTSRLENGIVALTPAINSVNELLESLDWQNAARKKQIRCKTEIEGELKAFFDFKWTREALVNILDNAVKYTPTGGSIEIKAKEYEMFVSIEIKDNGIGISEEETAKIFTRFYRSPQVAQEEGVGIGLYLSREIIGKEAGYIKVRSQLGKGSCFSVFLPKNINVSKL